MLYCTTSTQYLIDDEGNDAHLFLYITGARWQGLWDDFCGGNIWSFMYLKQNYKQSNINTV